jgi:hypothetical protein
VPLKLEAPPAKQKKAATAEAAGMCKKRRTEEEAAGMRKKRRTEEESVPRVGGSGSRKRKHDRTMASATKEERDEDETPASAMADERPKPPDTPGPPSRRPDSHVAARQAGGKPRGTLGVPQACYGSRGVTTGMSSDVMELDLRTAPADTLLLQGAQDRVGDVAGRDVGLRDGGRARAAAQGPPTRREGQSSCVLSKEDVGTRRGPRALDWPTARGD